MAWYFKNTNNWIDSWIDNYYKVEVAEIVDLISKTHVGNFRQTTFQSQKQNTLVLMRTRPQAIIQLRQIKNSNPLNFPGNLIVPGKNETHLSLDIKLFMEAIKCYPELYDKKVKEYADKTLKKNLQCELCTQCVEKWDELGYKEKKRKR